MSSRDHELSEQQQALQMVNRANSVIEKSEPPKKKVLFDILGLPISVAVIVNALIIISIPTLLILLEYGVITAKKIGFYCGDPLFSHKYTGDTITPLTLGLTAVALPTLTIILIEVLAHESWKKMDIRRAWLHFQECLVGTTVVLLLTCIAKMLVGEHRPHFFDVCLPDTARNCTTGRFVETFECTNTEQTWLMLVDSSLSFPSGHSSVSWFLAMVLSYLIQTRLTTINTGALMKPFLISVCLTWSLVCSLTRITDRRHHWWDVLAGTIIGTLYSIFSMTIIHKKTVAMERAVFASTIKDAEHEMA